MSLFCRVIEPSELEEVFEFESKKIQESFQDPTEAAIQIWNSRWRKESLEHYLSSGWSFLARDSELESTFSNEGMLLGYFIAQPLIFFDGQTQCLWVEHISFSSLQVRDSLCELAYKLCREKHFQRLLLPNLAGIGNSVAAYKPEAWGPNILSIKTSK